MKVDSSDRSLLIEILVIIISALLATLLMGHLNAFERLVLFLQTHELLNFVNYAVFLPSFLAMGFILFAVNKIDQLQKELNNSRDLQNKLAESDKKYKELSIRDELTQLYNSRHFYHQLKAETERATRYNCPLSLAMIDIDDFKKHNDAYGHVEGDVVLSSLGKLINDCLRGVDSGYRYGGEEFTIILPDTDLKGAVNIAERIRKGFEALVFLPAPGKEVRCTLSVGVAQFEPALELKAFIGKADKAMYMAKNQGKNRVAST